jgi:hypothetical protein
MAEGLLMPSKQAKTPRSGTATRRSRGPRASLRSAVDAFCKACINDPYEEGSWKFQVRYCTGKDCPLYPVRPGQRAQR